MKKTFDCVEMKRKIQEKIYDETKGLTKEAEIDYFHRAAEAFWKEIEKNRSKRMSGQTHKDPRKPAPGSAR